MPRHHHHRGRHDVYDDTRHNQEWFDPANEVTVHRRQSHTPVRRNSRHGRRESNPLVPDPFHDMDSVWRAAERDMDSFFGSGFGSGMFGSMRNMMTSMDRMFDDIAANAGPQSGGTYYYESRKMTVGPDGRVQEETVRTVPDAHGNPQTSRTIRDGDRIEQIGPHSPRIRGAPSSRPHNNDVIIEELDENGYPIHETRVARRTSRDERRSYRRDERGTRRDEEGTAGGWLRNKYREWRSGV